MENLLSISGVRGYVDENGIAQLNLEDVARGLGFTDSTRGTEYVKWDRIRQYLSDLSFSTVVSKDSYIPENIFYRLAMKARNTVAEAFQAKVADEILPAIRKHGGYLTPDKIEEALLNPDVLIQLATQLKQERTERMRLEVETAQKSAIITEQAPKVEYHDQILASEGTLLVSHIAKDYGIIAQDLNLVLKDAGVQYMLGKQWLPTAKYQSLGYTKSETVIDDNGHSRVRTKWTQAGRLFIHQLLMSKGIRPGYGPDVAGAEYIDKLRKSEAGRKKKKQPPQPARKIYEVRTPTIKKRD